MRPRIPKKYLYADVFAQVGILLSVLTVCAWIRLIPSICARMKPIDRLPLWFAVVLLAACVISWVLHFYIWHQAKKWLRAHDC